MSWNFNVDGFQSAVAYTPRTREVAGRRVTDDALALVLPDDVSFDTRDLVHTSHVLVRARIEGDLDGVKRYDEAHIAFEDVSADYQYRVIVRREAFAAYQYDLAMGIDYTSHVKEVMNSRSPKAAGRMSAYYAVWTALSRIQPNPPYGYPRAGTARW